MTREDAKRREELLKQERECIDNANEAIRNKSSVGAREWFEAAQNARRLVCLIEGDRDA